MQHGQMVKQSGLPRAEEAREDGHRDAPVGTVRLLRRLNSGCDSGHLLLCFFVGGNGACSDYGGVWEHVACGGVRRRHAGPARTTKLGPGAANF